ncbi:ribosome-associated translation inhibitor RaiA [bacterium]|nr:ribosome-associated translation inhibitor RaiA [bacterium]
MQVNVKTLNMEMTDAIRQYIDEKTLAIAKIVDEYDGAAMVEVEVGKSTNHHNKGPFMRAEMMLTMLGNVFRAEEEREDLYEAIDVCKDDLKRQVVEHKDRAKDEQRAQRPDKE